jgi:hypothetical protein
MPDILRDYDKVRKQLVLCDELGTHNEDSESFEATYYEEVLAKMTRLLEDGLESRSNHKQWGIGRNSVVPLSATITHWGRTPVN